MEKFQIIKFKSIIIGHLAYYNYLNLKSIALFVENTIIIHVFCETLNVNYMSYLIPIRFHVFRLCLHISYHGGIQPYQQNGLYGFFYLSYYVLSVLVHAFRSKHKLHILLKR